MWPDRKHSDRGAILNQDEEIVKDEAHWFILLLWFNLDNTVLTSRPLDPQCEGSPLELGEEAWSLGDNQGICWCLLDAALLRLTSSHLVEPARKTQDTLEVLCVSQLAWEHPRKSWLGRIYFGYPMYKVWVGLELQLDNGIKTSPSSNFCWLKSTQNQNSAYIHH